MAPQTILHAIATHARERGDAGAYVELDDDGQERLALDFAQLHERVEATAAGIAATVAPGDRVLLLYPPGIDYAVGVLACMRAGAVLCHVQERRQPR